MSLHLTHAPPAEHTLLHPKFRGTNLSPTPLIPTTPTAPPKFSLNPKAQTQGCAAHRGHLWAVSLLDALPLQHRLWSTGRKGVPFSQDPRVLPCCLPIAAAARLAPIQKHGLVPSPPDAFLSEFIVISRSRGEVEGGEELLCSVPSLITCA